MQTLVFPGLTGGGNFTLTYNGVPTAPITFAAGSAAQRECVLVVHLAPHDAPAPEAPLGGGGLGGQGGGRLGDAPRAQRGGDGGGQARELVQFALLERRVPVDHGLPHAGVGAALVGEEQRRRLQRGGDELECGRVAGRLVHPVDERLEEPLLPVEKHLALVAEVTEKGPLGQPDGLRDLGRRRLLEPARREQLKRRRLQALSRARLPTHHAAKFSDDSYCRTGVG